VSGGTSICICITIVHESRILFPPLFCHFFPQILPFTTEIGHFVTFMKKDGIGYPSFQKFGVLLRVV
jgi:hypothetical protein